MSSRSPVESPGLHRGLGRFDVVALCVNSIVGAGVFALPAGLALDAGRYSLAVIFVAFVVVAFLALSLAEVSSRYDVTGGPQIYAERTFGPLTGFTVGWLFSVSRLASYALIAKIMLDYAAAPDALTAHEMRKRVKKLRYEAELFRPALRRRMEALLEALVPLQELLGELHDADVRLGLLEGFAAEGTATERTAARQLLERVRRRHDQP